MSGRMIRSFLPVGHGAFYCEQFKIDGCDEKINIIYDCGSKRKKLVEEYIEQNFDEGETIHALFISHLHSDHINGIPKLLKYCKVKNIFFPLLSDEVKTITAIYNTAEMDKNSFAASFVMNPITTLKNLVIEEMPILHQVVEGNPEYEEGEANSTELLLDEEGISNIKSGANIAGLIHHALRSIYLNAVDWMFVPYNFKCEEKQKKLMTALKTRFKKNMSNSDLKAVWESGVKSEFDKVKSAYESVDSSHNAYTMTLYSGTKGKSCLEYINSCCAWQNRICPWRYELSSVVGCLYMGDYEANDIKMWSGLRTAYRRYWEYISCVQIPHHGSKYNYNTEITNLRALFVISANQGDHKHPAPSVMKDLMINDRDAFIVTEKSESILHFVICF